MLIKVMKNQCFRFPNGSSQDLASVIWPSSIWHPGSGVQDLGSRSGSRDLEAGIWYPGSDSQDLVSRSGSQDLVAKIWKLGSGIQDSIPFPRGGVASGGGKEWARLWTCFFLIYFKRDDKTFFVFAGIRRSHILM